MKARESNGVPQPPSPQPPSPFLILSLILSFFSSSLLLTPLLPLLFIITRSVSSIREILSPHILSRSPCNPPSLFLIYLCYSLLFSDLCFRNPSSVDLSKFWCSNPSSLFSLLLNPDPLSSFTSNPNFWNPFSLDFLLVLRSLRLCRVFALPLEVMMAYELISSMMIFSISTIYIFFKQEQVLFLVLTYLISPTATSIMKGHSNTQVLRVHKYPTIDTILNQIRKVLRVVIHLISKYVRIGLIVVFYLFKHFGIRRSVLKIKSLVSWFSCSNKSLCFFVCGMASSPRLVLECVAGPICLEERWRLLASRKIQWVVFMLLVVGVLWFNHKIEDGSLGSFRLFLLGIVLLFLVVIWFKWIVKTTSFVKASKYVLCFITPCLDLCQILFILDNYLLSLLSISFNYSSNFMSISSLFVHLLSCCGWRRPILNIKYELIFV